MARVALTPNSLSANGSLADPTGTATVAGAGNGLQIAAVPEGVVLRVSNGTAGSGTVSILAGTQPLANASGVGPLVVTIAAAGVSWIGPFDSSRFEQSDGSLIIESSVVMTVTAFKTVRKYV